jgi:hypothetical protein
MMAGDYTIYCVLCTVYLLLAHLVYAMTYELRGVKRSLWTFKQVGESTWLQIGKCEVSGSSCYLKQ